MGFVDGLNAYFTNVLDATMYIMYFFFTSALVIFTLPKRLRKIDGLWIPLKFVAIYLSYVFLESLFFGCSSMIGLQYGGIIFTASFAVIPTVYLIFFSKDYPLHKAVKILMMVASFLITSEIGRSLGFIVGGYEVSTKLPTVVCRSLPTAFMPLIAFIIYKFNIHRFKRLPIAHVFILLALSLLLIISSIWQNILNPSDNNIRWLLIFISCVELLVLISIYYAVYYFIDSRHRITELEVQSTMLSLEKESLTIDIQNREELMKIRHDLQNQLSYMNVLLNEGKYEEAKNYIASLINQKEEYLYSFSCSNLVISGIVNLELTKAKIADKRIRFKVVVPPHLPFEDSDLLSLITNIVDNSIENFVPASPKDQINVSIVTQQDYLRIMCLNTVDEKSIKDKPSLRTTKNNRGHGYGTKIIKNIVKKYEGHASFSYEEDKFVCDCMINMNHKRNINA